jgi:putative ABC transport system permease protein
MFKTFWIVFLRQVQKFASTYVLNLLGLSFGFACCLACFIHIRYQLSFDRFHTNVNSVFRLTTGNPALDDYWVKVSPPIPPKLKSEIPEIESYARLTSVSYNERVIVQTNEHVFSESYFMMADPELLVILSYPLLMGDKSNVLKDISDVIISETTARKLFGDSNPVGQTIHLVDNNLDFVVSGVFRDLPDNTHLRIDYLISFSNLERIYGPGSRDSWGQYNYFAYVKLLDNTDRTTAQNKIQKITVELKNRQVEFKDLFLQPITDIHFEHNRGNLLPSYDIRYTYIFSTLSFTVLIICLMNYFNLSGLLALKRIKEVGVRKSLGAISRQVNLQFVLEGFVLSFIAMLAGMGIVFLLQPVLQSAMGGSFEFELTDRILILFILVLLALLTIVSFVYLATIVNRITTVSILRGLVANTSKSPRFQQAIILFQITLSIVLLSCSAVIVNQMNFLHNKDLGFDKEGVMNISLSGKLTAEMISTMKLELNTLATVTGVAASDFVPGKANWHQTTWWEGQTAEESMFVMNVGKDFVSAMGIDIIEGSLEEIETSTEKQYIINESAQRQIGWTSAKGKFISPFGERNKLPVTAVVKDFNFQSLHNEIAPLVIVVYPDRNFSQLAVRMAPGNLRKSIEDVHSVFKRIAPSLPFSYMFMDETIYKLYESESRMQGVIVTLTIISVLFAVLGLFTMISFAIQSRTKEVAIRKVLGVSAQGLISLFTTTYFKLIGIAAIIGAPFCWMLMDSWLTNFNEHISLSPLIFLIVLSGMLILVLVIGVIKYVSILKINPAILLKRD